MQKLEVDGDAAVGWDEIVETVNAQLLRSVDERTVRRWAERNRDPLPVFAVPGQGRGGVAIAAHRSGLRDWVRRQVLPYLAHVRLARRRG